MSNELHNYLAAYDADDQDRTPSDFTVLALRTAALSRVAAENERLRAEIRDRENSEQDVRARLADAETALARVDALADEWEATGDRLQGVPASQTWLLVASRLRAALDGGR